jgi:predicted lipoprotein
MKTTKYIFFSLIALMCLSTKCKDKPDDNSPENYDKVVLLTNLSNNYIVPSYKQFKTKTENLKSSIESFNSSPNETTLTTCQNELKATMLSWQSVSILEFGPAESISLRAQTNIFPVDTAQISSNINSNNYNLELPDNYNAKGLQALDYLLFNPNFTSTELVNYYSANTNAKTYLNNVALELNTNANKVYNDWSGTYKTTFINNNESNAIGSSVSNIINTLSLHFETYVRKGRVGIPLGVFNGVSQQTMPGHVEAYYSGYSTELVVQQMKAIKNLINGTSFIGSTNGEGFDDYLDFVEAKYGEENLSTAINSQIDLVSTNLNTLNGSIDQDIDNNNQSVQNVYQSMQQLVPLIKIELTAALGVLVSYQDNDGD